MWAWARKAARAAASWLGIALVAVVAAGAAPSAARAEEAALRLFSYEALPSAQTALSFEGVPYAEREAATAAALAELAPKVFLAVGVDPADVETDLTPGGYMLKTNASLQARARVTEAEATRLAAALGYVFRQWSVLVSRLDTGGGTGWVSVGFPEGALDAALAQGFFEHAAAISQGLGGGYTAFGDAMIFLNVRGSDGAPYSGLGDMDFAAFLGQAAGSFGPARAEIADAGFAEARFVENDWATAGDGEDYAALIGDATVLALLAGLRAEHDALIARFVAQYGWK